MTRSAKLLRLAGLVLVQHVRESPNFRRGIGRGVFAAWIGGSVELAVDKREPRGDSGLFAELAAEVHRGAGHR